MRLFLDDTEVLRWGLIDESGAPLNLGAATVGLQLFGPESIILNITADVLTPSTDGKVEVQFPVGFFPLPGDYTGRWRIMFATGQVSSIPGVVVRVYSATEATKLYANLLDLEGLIGHVDDVNLALVKLEAATAAVRGYTPMFDTTLPIPDRMRQATAIIAARLYSAPAVGGDSGRIASEAIGDYRIAYQKETTAAGLVIGSDPLLANLLSPWHPRAANVYVGPDYDDAPLPIEAETITEVVVIEEEAEQVLDMNPTALHITGVRAGDSNTRTFVLTSDGAPLDLTDVTLDAQARTHPASPIVALTADIVVTDALAGRFELSWPGDQVEPLVLGGDWEGVWDLQATEGLEDPVTLLEGTIQCESDVTR